MSGSENKSNLEKLHDLEEREYDGMTLTEIPFGDVYYDDDYLLLTNKYTGVSYLMEWTVEPIDIGLEDNLFVEPDGGIYKEIDDDMKEIAFQVSAAEAATIIPELDIDKDI